MEKLKIAVWFDREEPSDDDIKNVTKLGYKLCSITYGTILFKKRCDLITFNGIPIIDIPITYSEFYSLFKKIGNELNSDYQEVSAIFGDMPMILCPFLSKRHVGGIPFFQREDGKFLLHGTIPIKGE